MCSTKALLYGVLLLLLPGQLPKISLEITGGNSREFGQGWFLRTRTHVGIGLLLTLPLEAPVRAHPARRRAAGGAALDQDVQSALGGVP